MGNRTSQTLDGTSSTWVYDDNNKLTSASGGGQSANFSYDNNGNITSNTGTMFPNKNMTYNDANRVSSVTYGGVTDYFYYTYTGLRHRARIGGTYYRYLYNGERVLEDLNDSGTTLARYTTENGSYSGMLLHIQRATGESRFPMYDNIGSVRGLVDASGTVTDTYELDTFGRRFSSSGTTPNPYKFGGAWGYITDPSGLLQLGERYYWPEVGRFVSEDPSRHGIDWYAYVDDNPLVSADPSGLKKVCRTEGWSQTGSDDWWDAWKYAFTCKVGAFAYVVYDVYYRTGIRRVWEVEKERTCCKDDECPGAQWECGDWKYVSAKEKYVPIVALKRVLVQRGIGITKFMLDCSQKLSGS